MTLKNDWYPDVDGVVRLSPGGTRPSWLKLSLQAFSVLGLTMLWDLLPTNHRLYIFVALNLTKGYDLATVNCASCPMF
jgi:hypothetical protein